MNNFVTLLSTKLDAAKRVIKVLRYGKDDVQTSSEVSPYGLDSNPIKDMIAMYAATSDKAENAIIGYINKNQKALPGEFRTYATDDDGAEKCYTWLKKDGTYEMLGNNNYAVLFNELKTEFNKLKQSHNDLLTEYKLHTHNVISVGNPTAQTVSTQLPNASNIDNAKNTKIKTNS